MADFTSLAVSDEAPEVNEAETVDMVTIGSEDNTVEYQ